MTDTESLGVGGFADLLRVEADECDRRVELWTGLGCPAIAEYYRRRAEGCRRLVRDIEAKRETPVRA